jgi:hypothetical protein
VVRGQPHQMKHLLQSHLARDVVVKVKEHRDDERWDRSVAGLRSADVAKVRDRAERGASRGVPDVRDAQAEGDAGRGRVT